MVPQLTTKVQKDDTKLTSKLDKLQGIEKKSGSQTSRELPRSRMGDEQKEARNHSNTGMSGLTTEQSSKLKGE